MTRFVRTFIFGAAWLLAVFPTGKATMVVWDPGLAAQNAGNEVVNLSHWVATETNTLNTELNTLRSYENSIVQLTRMGDPSQLRNLPVIGTIAQLAGSAGQIYRDYQQWSAFANPQDLQGTMNGILSQYSRPTWQGFLSSSGNWYSPTPGLYQFDVSRYQISTHAEQQLQALEQKRQTLISQRDSTLNQIQSATDQSAVQKLNAVLNGINGQLQQLTGQEAAIHEEAQLKTQQVNSAQAISQTSEAEQLQSTLMRNSDEDMKTISTFQSVFKPMHFGGQ